MSGLIVPTYEKDLFKSYLVFDNSTNGPQWAMASFWFGVPVTSTLFYNDIRHININGRIFNFVQILDRNPLGENDGRRYFVCNFGTWGRNDVYFLKERCAFYTDGLIRHSG